MTPSDMLGCNNKRENEIFFIFRLSRIPTVCFQEMEKKYIKM